MLSEFYEKTIVYQSNVVIVMKNVNVVKILLQFLWQNCIIFTEYQKREEREKQ